MCFMVAFLMSFVQIKEKIILFYIFQMVFLAVKLLSENVSHVKALRA